MDWLSAPDRAAFGVRTDLRAKGTTYSLAHVLQVSAPPGAENPSPYSKAVSQRVHELWPESGLNMRMGLWDVTVVTSSQAISYPV